MSGRTVHFLLHVPKCAGTTVEAHFRTHLGEVQQGGAFMIAPRWESPLRNLVGNRYPGLAPERLAGVRAVSGHSLSRSMAALFPGASLRESVLLREPLGYLLSFYNYHWTRFDEGWGARPPAFGTWYRAQRRNPVSRFLLNRYFEQGVPALYRLSSAGRLAWLEARLARFHFVGSHERADEMIAGISRELGVPEAVEHRNVTPARRLRPGDLPSGLAARIAAENALDQTLWERWRDRGWAGAPWEGAVRGPAAAPPLPRADQPRYVAGDIGSGILKKLIR